MSFLSAAFQTNYNIVYRSQTNVDQLSCKHSHLFSHLIIGNHLQQGLLHLLRGKQTNYKEVCVQQTVKMPYHIMQTEGTDAISPQMNHFFWEAQMSATVLR